MAYQLKIEIEELTVERISMTLEKIQKEFNSGLTSGYNKFSEKADSEIEEMYGVKYDSGSYEYKLINK